MSGPKTDHVELERQRQAELERQRQERLRRIREETDRLDEEITKAKLYINFVNNHLSDAIKQAAGSRVMALHVKKIVELKSVCKNALINAIDVNIPTEPDAIASYRHRIANIVSSAIATYTGAVQQYEDMLGSHIKNQARQMKRKTSDDGFSGKLEKREAIEDFDFSMMKQSVSESIPEADVKEQASLILSEIEDLVNNEAIQQSDMENLLAIAGNVYEAAFKTGEFFTAAANEYKAVKSGIERNIKRFEDIYHKYYAEYIAYLAVLNETEGKPAAITPKEKYLFENIAELQSEFSQLVKASKSASELSYIRNQINEVMQQFGYNMSNEVVFSDDHTGNHYICNSQTGQSAIHVYISDKEQRHIMMEIVGVSSSPTTENAVVTSTELSEDEREILLNEQGRFCDLHPKIVQALSERGVVFNERSREPVSLETCRKIIHSQHESAFTPVLVNKKDKDHRRQKRGSKARYHAMKY